MDLLDAYDLADSLDSLANDVIERGAVVSILANRTGCPANSALQRLETIDSLLIVKNNFLLMREHGSVAWITCDRSGDAQHDRFLNQQIAFVEELKSLGRWNLSDFTGC